MAGGSRPVHLERAAVPDAAENDGRAVWCFISAWPAVAIRMAVSFGRWLV
jgi:hypothetical protein